MHAAILAAAMLFASSGVQAFLLAVVFSCLFFVLIS
jgi:hypothetical protein